MNKKYVLKGLLVVVFIPLTVHYFLTTPGSEVSFSSLFILIGVPIWINEEIRLSLDASVNRTNYQVFIDWAFIMVLIAISIDVVFSFIYNSFN